MKIKVCRQKTREPPPAAAIAAKIMQKGLIATIPASNKSVTFATSVSWKVKQQFYIGNMCLITTTTTTKHIGLNSLQLRCVETKQQTAKRERESSSSWFVLFFQTKAAAKSQQEKANKLPLFVLLCLFQCQRC